VLDLPAPQRGTARRLNQLSAAQLTELVRRRRTHLARVRAALAGTLLPADLGAAGVDSAAPPADETGPSGAEGMAVDGSPAVVVAGTPLDDHDGGAGAGAGAGAAEDDPLQLAEGGDWGPP
jgi:hypothetical protein